MAEGASWLPLVTSSSPCHSLTHLWPGPRTYSNSSSTSILPSQWHHQILSLITNHYRPFSFSAHQSAALLLRVGAHLFALHLLPCTSSSLAGTHGQPRRTVGHHSDLRPCVHSRSSHPPGLPLGRDQLSRRQSREGAAKGGAGP